MKSIIKFLELNNITYKICKNGVIISLNRKSTWINGYNETMSEDANISLIQLKDYSINNYRTYYHLAYNQCETKEHRKINNVTEYLTEILKKEGLM